MITKHRILGTLAAAALAAAALRCGSASSGASGIPSPSNGNVLSGAAVDAGRERWDAGPSGSEQAGSGGATGASVDADAGTPANQICPGLSREPSSVTLAVPRSRATVSPVQARGVLLGDAYAPATAPDAASIQVNEFLNYYRVSYGAPKAVSVTAELAPGPFPLDELLLQVGIQAPPAHHGPTVITAVVDTSLSMTGAAIARARAALTALLASLQAGDQINLLTSNPDFKPLSFTVGGPGDPTAGAAASAITVDGGDDLGGALAKGYQLAGATTLHSPMNRVVLITDGAVPVSTIDLGLLDLQSQNGIHLVGVGVGPAFGYQDTVLALATEAGRGADVYLDSVGEADVMLHQRFDEVMGVAASALTVNLTLPWFLSVVPAPPAQAVDGGTQNTEGGGGGLAQTDLGFGQALVYRQVLRACDPAALALSGTVKVGVSYTAPDGSSVTLGGQSPDVTALPQTLSAPLAKANAVVAFAEALQSRDPTRLAGVLALINATTTASLFKGDADFYDKQVGIVALIAREQGLVQ